MIDEVKLFFRCCFKKSLEHPFVIILSVLFLTVIFPVYVPLYQRFVARDSYYSHGFLVPFITIFLIWRKRSSLMDLSVKNNLWGMALTCFGCLLFVLSRFFVVNIASYVAAFFMLSGILLFLFGWDVFKHLLFPLSFLLFMFPLPSVVIIKMAFQMKMIASFISTFLVNLIGIEAKVAGSNIVYSGGSLVVGDPCSGLRSMISFLALGVFLIQVLECSHLKKTVVFFSVIPIAILSNVSRIFVLTVVCFIYGDHLAAGFLHDFTGIMVFVVAFAGLMSVMRILNVKF